MKDGGPIFPQMITLDRGTIYDGMSLRDYFAAQAMNGLVERWSPSAITASAEIAGFAYNLADAMLKERESTPCIPQETGHE